MFTQAQLEYIQKQFARGLNKDAIRNKLLDAGWEISDIEDGFREYEKTAPKTDAQIASEMNTNVQSTSTADAASANIAQQNIQPVDPALNTPGLQAQVQPQVEVVKTMPSAGISAAPKSGGNKIIFIILGIIVVLAAGAFAYYKFIYLPKMGSVDTNTASSTVVTLPESSQAPVQAAASDTIPSLPQVDGMTPTDNTGTDNNAQPSENLDQTNPSGTEPIPSM